MVKLFQDFNDVFEEIMEKDPTCSQSLGRLVRLHRSLEHSTEKLVEI